MSKKEENKTPQEIAEVSKTLEQISQEEPEIVSEILAMSKMGIVSNPLYEKLTEEHLGKIVDLAVSHDNNQFNLFKQSQENRFTENTSNKRYTFVYFLCAILSFFAIILIFKDQPEILIPALSGFTGLAGGFLAGFGFGKSR